MLHIDRHERDAIGRQIDALADEIQAVGLIGRASENRSAKLQTVKDKLDVLRDQLQYVRERT